MKFFANPDTIDCHLYTSDGVDSIYILLIKLLIPTIITTVLQSRNVSPKNKMVIIYEGLTTYI